MEMAKKMKIGRNDPCPCGSGKKFKNCCGQMSDITPVYEDIFMHYSQLLASTKLKLDRYFEKDVKKQRKQIKAQFTRFSVSKNLRNEHETIFSDWMWFDLQDNKGNSMSANYLQENQAFMDHPLLECLESLNNSYLSVYRVEGSTGVELNIRDIFLNKNYQVLIKEPLTIKESDPDILLLARMVQMPQINLFSGMVLMLENDALQEDFIKEHLLYVQNLYGIEIQNMLKKYAEKVYGIFDHAGQKMLVNLNDMRAADINETERISILEKLFSNEEYTLQHKMEGFSWFKRQAETAGYSRILVGNDVLLSCSDVLEDVTLQEKSINSILPGKKLEIINSLMMQTPPDIKYNNLWFTVLKDQECEKWLSTPHSELGGKTPSEILGEGGQTRILNLLDDYISSVSIEEEKELLEYMKTRIEQVK